MYGRMLALWLAVLSVTVGTSTALALLGSRSPSFAVEKFRGCMGGYTVVAFNLYCGFLAVGVYIMLCTLTDTSECSISFGGV